MPRKIKAAIIKPGPEAAPSPTPTPTAVNWPPFANLISQSDLSLITVVENQILTIPQLWTSSLCRSYVTFLKTLALTTTPGQPKKGDAVRVNDRFQVHDPAFAERLWSETALKELVTGALDGHVDAQSHLWGGEVLGLNPNIRIYRYTQGQFFDKHYDDSNRLDFQPRSDSASTKGIPAKTTWTLLLYLTSAATGCKGGETVFYPDPQPRSKRSTPPPLPIVTELQVGMALLHRHGDQCMLHEGREVVEGEKWVVRSDLVVRR